MLKNMEVLHSWAGYTALSAPGSLENIVTCHPPHPLTRDAISLCAGLAAGSELRPGSHRPVHHQHQASFVRAALVIHQTVLALMMG